MKYKTGILRGNQISLISEHIFRKKRVRNFRFVQKARKFSERLLVCCEKISTGSVHENTLSEWLHSNLKSATLVTAHPPPRRAQGANELDVGYQTKRGREKEREKKEKKERVADSEKRRGEERRERNNAGVKTRRNLRGGKTEAASWPAHRHLSFPPLFPASTPSSSSSSSFFTASSSLLFLLHRSRFLLDGGKSTSGTGEESGQRRQGRTKKGAAAWQLATRCAHNSMVGITGQRGDGVDRRTVVVHPRSKPSVGRKQGGHRSVMRRLRQVPRRRFRRLYTSRARMYPWIARRCWERYCNRDAVTSRTNPQPSRRVHDIRTCRRVAGSIPSYPLPVFLTSPYVSATRYTRRRTFRIQILCGTNYAGLGRQPSPGKIREANISILNIYQNESKGERFRKLGSFHIAFFSFFFRQALQTFFTWIKIYMQRYNQTDFLYL